VALRTPLRITTTPITDPARLPGEGTIAQIEADLAALAALGVETLLLDTRYGDADRLRPPAHDRADLESIAHLTTRYRT
jgi:hypothetical protein